MQTIRRAISAYGQASETLAPAQQIVLLYEGAIRRIREARQAIELRRVADRCVAVHKATAIIEGLQSCLDHARGGEIARNLDLIYTHVIFRLQRLNLADDPAICDEVIARLDQLRAAWAELAGGAPPAAAGHARPTADHAVAVTI
jgi:flagellar secretion chaperone FliS